MTSKSKAAAGAALALLIASPVFALDTNVGASAGATVNAGGAGANVGAKLDAKLEARITTAKSHADQEIDRRIQKLNELNTKVQGMTRVSASEKASIATQVSTEVTNLTTLKAKIDADTDIATLKADIKSIAQSYRIFMLVIPVGRIEVAADKIDSVIASMGAFATKLQTRIDAAKNAGKDTTTLEASLSDMNAKLADAKVQADAAVSHVANLQPDNGDKTVMASNDAAIKLSKADLKIALQDLAAARKDAGAIIKGLVGMSAGAGMQASSTTTVNP